MSPLTVDEMRLQLRKRFGWRLKDHSDWQIQRLWNDHIGVNAKAPKRVASEPARARRVWVCDFIYRDALGYETAVGHWIVL